MKNTQKAKFIKIIILLTAIIIFIFIQREKRSYQHPDQITELPKFEAIDINGSKVKSSDFKGRNLYIQFINSRFQPDIFLLETVYTKWVNENLHFLGIISDSTDLNLKRRFNSKNIIFIEKNYFDLCSKFNLNPNNGFYFLVNKNRIVISSGRNDLGYERGPKVFLQELIKGDFFSISELIIENKHVNDFKWFSQVNNLIKNNEDKEYFIISLFTEICDSCSGGNIIQTLKRIYREKNDSVYILSILNGKFDSEDIINLKSQLKISHPVILADNKLNIKWDSLIKRYREDFLTDIIFIAEKSGKILKTAYRKCKCYSSFFNYVYSLIKEEK